MQHKTSTPRYFSLGFIIASAIAFADQYSKWLVMETMLRMEKNAVYDSFFGWFVTERKISFFANERETFNTVAVTPFLNFVMVWNEGISFGMLSTSSPLMPLILMSVSILISLLMLLWMSMTPHKSVALPLALIVGGAIGNVIDRIRFGAVADFIDLHINGFHWPAFNLADSCIVVGASILIMGTLLSRDNKGTVHAT